MRKILGLGQCKTFYLVRETRRFSSQVLPARFLKVTCRQDKVIGSKVF